MSFAPGERNFTISADSGNLTMQADGSYLAVWISGATIGDKGSTPTVRTKTDSSRSRPGGWPLRM